jgi:hypothetical protein
MKCLAVAKSNLTTPFSFFGTDRWQNKLERLDDTQHNDTRSRVFLRLVSVMLIVAKRTLMLGVIMLNVMAP